jgi:chorismate mutase/prephenate dehydratase
VPRTPRGLAQCRDWLAAHLPEAVTEETPSTAAAVERAARRRDGGRHRLRHRCAGARRADPAGRIEDNPANSTRFLVIGRRPVAPTPGGTRRPSSFDEERAGVLYSILKPFAANRLNLTKIESRPTKRRPWEYVNFVDFDGHRDRKRPERAGGVRERCQPLKVLASYPAA